MVSDPRSERDPLTPGPPRPLLGWVRGAKRADSRGAPTWVRVGLVIAGTLALGTWGFLELRASPRLDFLQSLYGSIKLYTLDLGPAGGASPGPDWQIWIGLLAAAALVLRGIVALGRDRVRRWAVGHVLSGHVVICGGGVHGTQLARLLSPSHDVVLVDLDPVSPGMQELRGRYEWRLIGNAVSAGTLRAAGVARAHWLIAVTGLDFVNSQIVSGVRSLVDQGHARDRLHVLVQVEDPALTRFLEEEETSSDSRAGPVVSPFSTNAIAAEVLLDESKVRGPGDTELPMVAMHNGAAPNLLLVGDHPLLDALVLAVLRRWRVRRLRELESGSGRVRPPIHLSIYGPAAEQRVTALREAWRPEPEVLILEGRDSPPAREVGNEIDDWLRKPGRAEHAIVACLDELQGIALTLTAARALGDRARLTRVTTQFENELDAYVEQRTSASHALSTTEVKAIAELGARPEQMQSSSELQRLVAALERDNALKPSESNPGDRSHDPGDRSDDPGDRSDDPVDRARAVFSSELFTVRFDTTWRVREGDRGLLDTLLDLSPRLKPVPLSAILRAGLRLELDSAATLLAAATMLTERGDPGALALWCEYLRHPEADLTAPPLIRARRDASDLAIRRLLALAGPDASAGRNPDPALAGAAHITIFAGAAGSMTASTTRELEPLLGRALQRYDGVLLSGGTAAGMPGIVGRIARHHNLTLTGYVPPGRGDRELYPELRETDAATDFSVLEPLAMWQDIVASGFGGQVALIACPGGTITLQEITLARAMGARIGWLDPTGVASPTLEETLPFGAAGIVELPADSMTIRAFVAPTTLSDPPREAVARYAHNDYRRRQRRRKSYGDAALSRWEELPETLRASNLAQANDVPGKLALIGKRVALGGEPLQLTDEQVELLAEVEHGRWNAERLLAGWRVGPRHVGRSTSPDLVPWAELPGDTRDYDREAVRTIGPALADAGWGVTDA